MRRRGRLVVMAKVIFFLSLIEPALASDLILNQSLNTGYYLSETAIVAGGNCGVTAGRQVWFLAGKNIRLSNGFHVASGGMLNALIGGHRRVPQSLDLDGDKLADWWELAHFRGLTEDRRQDPDGDGLSNLVEYRLGSDPAATASHAGGIAYEYDQLGRIKGIIRVPSK